MAHPRPSVYAEPHTPARELRSAVRRVHGGTLERVCHDPALARGVEHRREVRGDLPADELCNAVRARHHGALESKMVPTQSAGNFCRLRISSTADGMRNAREHVHDGALSDDRHLDGKGQPLEGAGAKASVPTAGWPLCTARSRLSRPRPA